MSLKKQKKSTQKLKKVHSESNFNADSERKGSFWSSKPSKSDKKWLIEVMTLILIYKRIILKFFLEYFQNISMF